MGMPISSYTILKALYDKNAHRQDTNIALKALSPYNLFAFIIHDPEIHREFARQVSILFDRLDYITGNKLLFFALVDPPSDWLKHACERPYYKKLNNWETRELLNPKHAILSTDESITAFSLANSLGISTEELPCIVATADFCSEQILWFKTCPEHLEKQMERLGYIAARKLFHKSAHSIILKTGTREDPNLCNCQGNELLENSLAKTLSDVLSFIIVGKNYEPCLQQALMQVKEIILELSTTLSNLKRNFQENESEKIDKLCISLISKIAELNTAKDLKLDDFIPINKDFLENESYLMLKTAHKVFNLLVSGQEGAKLNFNLEDSLDFTPGLICLTKIFEKEANLSVVHWIRKELGISLPTYFNKPQPSVQAKLIPNITEGREINFNINRSGKWLPPGIGQSEIACSDLSKKNMPQSWDRASWNLLLDNWKIIREKRNEAAHTEMVGKASLIVVKKALMDLSMSKVFEKFCRMKSEYRGKI